MSLSITYGKHTVDFSAVPETSVTAMLRRGLSHFLGNEQASKVAAYFDPDRKVAEGESKLEDTPENREIVKADFQAKALDALLAGTVGTSTRGPTVDPIETEINRIARKAITLVLKDSGVKAPKKSTDTVTIGGQAFTMDQLIARRLDASGQAGIDKKTGESFLATYTKEATKIMADKAKAAKKAAEAVKDAGGVEAL